jgi:hypothetical protein
VEDQQIFGKKKTMIFGCYPNIVVNSINSALTYIAILTVDLWLPERAVNLL